MPKAGQKLPGTSSFDTLEAAIAAAKRRSASHDPELERMVYEMMANQTAARQQGAGPSYKQEASLRSRLGEDLPQAQLDWQMGYAIPEEPPPPPTGPNPDPSFIDRVFRSLRGMGMTGTQIANFLGKTLATAPGPRFSNREVIATEVESPFRTESSKAEPVTYERGVGFALEPQRKVNATEVAEGFFNPVPAVGGVLIGKQGVKRLGGEVERYFKEGQKAVEGGVTSPLRLWNDFKYSLGREGQGRAELPGAIEPEIGSQVQTALNLMPPRNSADLPLRNIATPELLAAYPELKQVLIELRGKPHATAYGGGASTTPGLPLIRYQAGPTRTDRAQFVPAMEHEIQHRIQLSEGFPSGASFNTYPAGSLKSSGLPPEVIQRLIGILLRDYNFDPKAVKTTGRNTLNYLRTVGEVEARNVEKRLLNPALQEVSPALTEDVPRQYQILAPGDRKYGQEMQSVKDPGGMWDPRSSEKMAAYLLSEITAGGPQGARQILRLGPESQGPIDTWATRVARNYLNKYAGTEQDPLKDFPVEAYVRQINRELLPPDMREWHEGRIQDLQRRLEAYYQNERDGNVVDPRIPGQLRDRIRAEQRILREGYVGFQGAREERPWGKIMDRVIRSMPFEEFLETVGRNRRAMGRMSPEQINAMARLENAYREGKFGKKEPVWYLRDTTALRDFPTTFKEHLGHVGAQVRGRVEPSELPRYDFPRAMRDTREWDTVKKLADTEAARREVFAGTKQLKSYDDGSSWVEVGKSDPLTELPEGWELSPVSEDNIRAINQIRQNRMQAGDQRAWDQSDAEQYRGQFYLKEPGGSVHVSEAGGPIVKDTAEALKIINRSLNQKALNKEGELMGHCVGGYCDAVESGRSRIYSLRDKKGEPHVTVEVRPGGVKPIDYPNLIQAIGGPNARTVWEDWHNKWPEYKRKMGISEQYVYGNNPDYVRAFNLFMIENHPNLVDRYLKGMIKKDSIVQIKGKQNRSPVAEYHEKVRDFLRTRDWDKVGDLQGLGLVDLHDSDYWGAIPWPKGVSYEDVKMVEQARGTLSWDAGEMWKGIREKLNAGRDRFATWEEVGKYREAAHEELLQEIYKSREIVRDRVLKAYAQRGWAPPNLQTSRDIYNALQDIEASDKANKGR